MAFEEVSSTFSDSEPDRKGSFTGRYAVSVAGHDAGRLYVIVGEEGFSGMQPQSFLLCDGRTHRFSAPKRKKRRHVRLLGGRDEAIAALLAQGSPVDDSVLIHSLRCFKGSGGETDF